MNFEGEGPWQLPIEGFQVMHMTIGAYPVDLFAYGEDGATAQVRVEAPFGFRDPAGEVLLLDPGEAWEPLAALFVLRQAAIRVAQFTKESELRVEFETGHTIGCAPERSDEAWELRAPCGIMVVGRAGELATWSGEGER